MRIVVEVLKDSKFRVWKEDRSTVPLDGDELVKQLEAMAIGSDKYPMRTVDEWYKQWEKEIKQRDLY